jgi:multiple sugar transport system substrate-binding protein
MTGGASTDRITLRGLGWDHDRCTAPLRACSEAWEALHPGIALSWHNRSLTDFGEEPVETVAHRYDLVMIDHPFCGTAEATATLRPLDDLLAPEVLAALAADSVGPSHASYTFHGRQWALATDAACQVAAVRDDLLGDAPAPATWDDVLALARAQPGRVAVTVAPAQAMCAFLTLCANAGRPAAEDPSRLVDPEAGLWALDLLSELYRLGPLEAVAWEQPDVLSRLTAGPDLVYVPIVFGFVTYSRDDRVERPCRFLDLPSAGAGPVGGILGGAGLAVSATSAFPAEAAAFAAFASGAEAQRSLVGPAGGQPGSWTAWTAPELDSAAHGFFSGTRATIEQAWVRPRECWWPAFQLEGGRLLNHALGESEHPERLLVALDELYLDCIRRETISMSHAKPSAGS